MRHLEAYTNPRIDEYAKQLLRQNQSLACEHCGSVLGHRRVCPLLNREAAEALAAERTKAFDFTDADKIAAHGLGVML